MYAHTDVEGGRSIQDLSIEIKGDVASVKHVERWHPLDRDLLDSIRALCTEQEERLRLEAVRLDGAIRRASEAAT